MAVAALRRLAFQQGDTAPLHADGRQAALVAGAVSAILPYDNVRAAADPAATLLGFYESAYRAGASAADWDVASFATDRASRRD